MLNYLFKGEDILEIENWFHSNRTTLPALFISTPYDKKTSVWSKESPNLQILIRVAMLARESLKLVEILLFTVDEDWKVRVNTSLLYFCIFLYL